MFYFRDFRFPRFAFSALSLSMSCQCLLKVMALWQISFRNSGMKAEFREGEICRQQQTACGDFDNHSASLRWTRDSLSELRTVTQKDDKCGGGMDKLPVTCCSDGWGRGFVRSKPTAQSVPIMQNCFGSDRNCLTRADNLRRYETQNIRDPGPATAPVPP